MESQGAQPLGPQPHKGAVEPQPASLLSMHRIGPEFQGLSGRRAKF